VCMHARVVGRTMGRPAIPVKEEMIEEEEDEQKQLVASAHAQLQGGFLQ
jgi:hypothetical protein